MNTLGYDRVTFPLHVLRRLYPLCRKADFDITVTLVHREQDWVITHVEPGDTTAHHYGLAVDYGSTTIVMQLLDMGSGAVVAEEKVVNGQVVYGTDILTRITYALEADTHMDDLQQVLVPVAGFHFKIYHIYSPIARGFPDSAGYSHEIRKKSAIFSPFGNASRSCRFTMPSTTAAIAYTNTASAMANSTAIPLP